MKILLGGVWREITAARAFIDGTWRTLGSAKSYNGGAWKQVANFIPPLSLAITPSPFNKSAYTATVTSNNITATPTGGLGPFNYSWSVVTSSQAVTINNPTSAGTTVSTTPATAYEPVSITLRCVATDSLGTTATATVDGTLTRYYSSFF